jgi:ArsR family transcriptional regulator
MIVGDASETPRPRATMSHPIHSRPPQRSETRPIDQVKAEFFNTLAHPARIRVLELLRDGERSVSELIPDVGLEPSHLSQQLVVLRRANGKIPFGPQFNTRRASFSRPIRLDKQGTGLSDPIPLHQIRGLELGEVGPCAEPNPPDASWAEPDLDAGADAMRYLYDHPDVAGEPGRKACASVTAIHNATASAASFRERFAASTGAGADR